MTEIITVASYKGGNGKTKLIIETLKELNLNGKKVLAIDTDIQKNLFQWVENEYEVETENTVVEVNEYLTVASWSIVELNRLTLINTQVFDYILIDTSPTTFGNRAIELANEVIVPVEKGNPSTIMSLESYIVKLKHSCRKIKIVTYANERNFIDEEILKQPNVIVLKNEIIWDSLVERILSITNENTVTELDFEVEDFEERKNEFLKSYKNVINELF